MVAKAPGRGIGLGLKKKLNDLVKLKYSTALARVLVSNDDIIFETVFLSSSLSNRSEDLYS